MADFNLTYQLEVSPSENGLSDVVKTIHWRYAIVEEVMIGDSKFTIAKTDTYGAVGLGEPTDNFTEFADLTDADIRAWLESKLDFAELETQLTAQLDAIQNPKTVMKELVNNG